MAVRRWGSEVQVNTGALGFQGAADVAALADGGWIVAWTDASAPSEPRVRLQRYDASGTPVGGERAIAAASPLSAPSVAALADGGFAIGAQSAFGAEDSDVQATRFDAAGLALSTLAIDGQRGPSSTQPALAPLGTGFVSIHERQGDLLVSWFDAAGTIQGGEIRVNDATAGVQNLPDVAELAQGGFAAVWTDQNLGRIQVRAFDAGGSPATSGEVQANSSSLGGNAGHAAVAGLASGGFVAVWESNTSAFRNSAPDIRARLFDDAGNPLGGEIAVNARTLGAQRLPEVVALPDGGFAVVWLDLNGTPSVRGRLFDAEGQRIGREFSVNTSPAADDPAPGDLSVAALRDGRLVVTWRGEDDSGSGVLQQVVDPRAGVVEGTSAGESLFGNNAWGDEISGFGGADALWGLRGDDVLFAGDGADQLRGGRGEDMLYGGRGDDTLLGEVGADDLFGGAGLDTASYAGARALVLALDGSLAATADAAGDVLVSIEAVTGTSAGDRLRGNSAANTLRGGEGADTLEGMAGADSLQGDGGDDVLLGGAGADHLSGGAGLDTASYAGAGALVLALDGSLAATADAAGDVLVSIEAVTGTSAGDRLRGNSAANTLRGGEGADTLEGMAGADSLQGDGGDDRLIGGAATDLLTGGAGADDFIFTARADSAPDATRDRITDFAAGLDDIVLNAIDANERVSGDQAFVLDKGGAFTAGEIRQIVVGGHLLLEFNTDADASAELSVLVMARTRALAAADFVL